ncbi:MAG: ABC transporter substrate-binding protein [Bacillota bacterium]
MKSHGKLVRMLRATLLTICILLLFAASTGLAARQETVTMWAFPLCSDDIEMYSKLVNEFEKENPNIKVHVEVLPWQGRMEKLMAALAANQAPDVMYLNVFLVPKLAATGNLAPLDKYLPSDVRADYFSGAIKSCQYDGRLYAMPVLQSVVTYIYNVDLFKKAGLDPKAPPETWAELEEAARKLTCDTDGDGKIDQWGIRFDLNRPSPITSVVPFVWQAGGDLISADGTEAIYDSPEAVRAVEFIKGLIDKGYMQKSNIQGGGLPFTSGKIGIDLQRENMDVIKLRAEGLDFEIAAGPILKDAKKIGYGTVGSYGILGKSKNKDAAAKWVLFLTRPDNMAYIMKNTGFVAPRKSVSPAKYVTDPVIKQFVEQAPNCRPETPHLYIQEVLSTMQPAIENALLGLKPVEAALKEGTAEANRIMRRK